MATDDQPRGPGGVGWGILVAVEAGLVVIVAALGLAVGSFLNVVVARVPEHRSVVRPPSACPGCAAPIRPRDNVPVVSWMALRGRCRACQAPIHWRYPAIEALTGGLFAALAARFGISPSLPAELALTAGLVALAAIDAERLVLPKRVVWPTGAVVAAGLVAAAASTGQWSRLLTGTICAAAAGAVFLGIHLASPRAMGFGDVRLIPVIGLATGWLGWQVAVAALFLANLLGALIGGTLILAGRRSRRAPLPFGVYLAAGAVIAVLASGTITLR